MTKRTAAISGVALAVLLAGCGMISGLDSLEEQACAPNCDDASVDASPDVYADAKDAADGADASEAAEAADADADADEAEAAEAGDALDDADGAADGDAEDTQEVNPCVGVSCNEPPINACASATELRVYTSAGTCDQGKCSYASSLTTCPFGCAAGACAGDPCIGVTCATPTKSYCSDATHLTVYELPGSCSAGACVYQSHQEFCTFGCAGDVCNGDPCVGVTCNKPPANYCSGPSELSVFAASGSCGGGACTYAKTPQYCAFGCDAGACKNDPCAGVSCATPPAAYCSDGMTLRTFSGPGSCTGGTCGFPSVDEACPGGCVVGACRECAKTADCPGGKWCNGGSCVACSDDLHCGGSCSDCSATSKVCNAGTSCVQCVVDSQCASGSFCSGNACVPCNTAARCGASCSPCGGTTPSCSGTACVCSATSCPSNQACSGGACGVCKTDAACGAGCSACGAPTPKCLDQGATSSCVACLSAGDCGAGKTCTGNACVSICSGTIASWDWNLGTAPTGTLTFKASSNWSVGAASAGPKDGKSWLATKPGGSYDMNLEDWVRLPKLDLTQWASCRIKVSVDAWIESEVGTLPYDGGNLQYTTDPASSTGWQVMDGGTMAYDGLLSTLSCFGDGSCFLYGQKVWASINGIARTGTFTSPSALGGALTLRFTFHSDASISKAGLYVKRVVVEALP